MIFPNTAARLNAPLVVVIAALAIASCAPVPTSAPTAARRSSTTAAPAALATTTTRQPMPTTRPAPTVPAPDLPTPTIPTTVAPTTTTSPPVTTTPPTPGVAVTLCATGTASGPAAAPAGAVTIRPGDNAAAVIRTHGPGTTYWFSPGTHALSATIDAQTGDRFLGAPGAVLDGGFVGVPAFAGGGTDVTIRSLTIQRFGTVDGQGWVNGAAVNRSAAARWTVEDSTLRLNDGNALFLGDSSITRRNCFADNGQTGLSAPALQRNGAYVALSGIVVTGNDIRANNRNDLESAPGACRGCTGGMKLWQTTGAIVTGNTVAGNHGVGIWLDNNNVDALVGSNVVTDNDREGIMVETSYNSRVTDNVVRGNALVGGRGQVGSFPVAGVFISNSGGSALLPGPAGIDVSGNRVDDNWNGVVVFWDADRYCGSAADTSVGHCTLGGATLASCAAQVEQPAAVLRFASECHWATTGVQVHDNDFSTSPSLAASCNGRCGRNGLIATTAPTTTRVRQTDGSVRSVPNPLSATWASDRVGDPATNRFWSNRYSGTWRFDLGPVGQTLTGAAWQDAGQDAA